RVPLRDVIEVRLGDVLRTQRIARQEARLRVLPRLCADVDRHRRATLTRDTIPAVHDPIEPGLEQILAFCAEDPVERVFLEDVARRGLGRFTAVEKDGRLQALCHAGSNVVPSGTGCDAFADVAVAGNARMVIGEEGAVTDL